MATKTIKPEQTDETKVEKRIVDPLFDIFEAEDDAGKPIPQTDVAALMKAPVIVKLKVGAVTHKIALQMGAVDYGTWIADDNHRRRYMLENGVHQGEDLTPEQSLHNNELREAFDTDDERTRLRATLCIAAIARNEDGVALTSLVELRESPTVATVLEPENYNLWGRRLINKCCDEIDAFFIS